MKTVFLQGAFDLLNAGHVRALSLAKQHGDKLVVGLNSDSLMRWYKREPIVPFKQRREILRAIRYVNEVIECHEPSALRYLQRFNADVYILTTEWEQQQQEAIAWIKSKGGRVVFSPRWKDIYDSTTIRARVRGET